jgi:endonuclease YncB( thermonuclease family)
MIPARHAAAALLAPLLCAGSAQTSLPGPVPAEVRRALDGDTLEVSARIWLGQQVETKVRLYGIDAPELHGDCEEERAKARAARAWLEARVAGSAVRLVDVRFDKYGGRVLARVLDGEGRDVGAALVSEGLARAYDGRRREPWCGR